MRIEQVIKSKKGFTLIEMIMVIVLVSIVFSSATVFIAAPITILKETSSRQELVNSAEMALRRMERDILNAVPNSIRVKQVSNIHVLEILNVVEGGRYRTQSPGISDDILDFNTADTSFNFLGNFSSDILGANGYRVVIYNTGASGTGSDDPVRGANVYSALSADGTSLPNNSHVITPASTSVTLSNTGGEGRVVFDVGHQFSLQSPTKRAYIVDTPVTYLCDTNAFTITKYTNYTLTEIQPVTNATTPLDTASSALLTNNISDCSFTYDPGTSQRNSVVTIRLTLTKNGETVELLQQVGVSNAP